MSDYLSGIAARSVPGDSFSVVPAIDPAFAFSKIGGGEEIQFEDPGYIAPGTHPSPSNYAVIINERHEATGPDNILRPLQPTLSHENKETFTKHISNYVYRHVERITDHKKVFIHENIFLPPQSEDDSSDPAQVKQDKIYLESLPRTDDMVKEKIQPADEKQLISAGDSELISGEEENIEQYKPAVVIPSFNKVGYDKKYQPVDDTIPVRIAPAPVAQDKTAQKNSINKPTPPRLTIGKLIVEVVPPAPATPPRIITRTVQTASPVTNSNKRLGFGLGQL